MSIDEAFVTLTYWSFDYFPYNAAKRPFGYAFSISRVPLQRRGTREMLNIGFRIPAWATPRQESENGKQIPFQRAFRGILDFGADFPAMLTKTALRGNLRNLVKSLGLRAYPKTQILAGATQQRRACQNLGFRIDN